MDGNQRHLSACDLNGTYLTRGRPSDRLLADLLALLPILDVGLVQGLTLTPRGAAKQVLKKKGSLKVKLTITFTPTGGSAKATSSAVTLKLK